MSGLLLTTSAALVTAASLVGTVTAAAAQTGSASSGPPGTDARLTPVSGGDAIIEPFWDSALATWRKWSQAVDGIHADCRQSWCW